MKIIYLVYIGEIDVYFEFNRLTDTMEFLCDVDEMSLGRNIVMAMAYTEEE